MVLLSGFAVKVKKSRVKYIGINIHEKGEGVNTVKIIISLI